MLFGRPPVAVIKMLLAGAFGGFLFGVAAHVFLFRYSEAVAAIEIGHVTTGDKVNGEAVVNLEAVGDLSERIRGRTVAAEVAKRTGNKDAEQILSGFRYGGDAGLTTRTIWNNNQIEIRVRARDDATALELLNGVDDTIVAQHKIIQDGLSSIVTDRVKALQKWVDVSLENKRALTEKVSESMDSNANFAILLVAGQQLDMDIARQTAILEDVRSNLVTPNLSPTRVISPPAISPRILSSAIAMGCAGIIAGLCLAVIIILLYPREKMIKQTEI